MDLFEINELFEIMATNKMFFIHFSILLPRLHNFYEV